MSKANNGKKTILITGAAGFIGANLALKLLKGSTPVRIVGVDNLNDYYDVGIKEYRLKLLAAAARGTEAELNPQASSAAARGTEAELGSQTSSHGEWIFLKGSIADREFLDGVFAKYRPDIVVNLAAQAGVRYSITNPDAYMQSNMIGFYNVLEACRHSYDSGLLDGSQETTPDGAQDGGRKATFGSMPDGVHDGGQKATSGSIPRDGQSAYAGVQHLVYASSSSVYGSNEKVPYSTDDRVDNPVSLYAATKKSNELMAHAYSKLYNIPSTGLRFFTVYGPAGRPDMAYFGFTDKLVRGDMIKIFNYGNCKRDFTYIDDIVEGVARVMEKPPVRRTGADGLPVPPYALYNIGNSNPENLLDFVEILSEELVSAGVLPADFDFESHKELVPMQPGDVPVTYADTSALERDFGFRPSTPLRKGLREFVRWYKDFYGR